MKLKGVQDIAGLRIVLSRDQDQDAVVAQLVPRFEVATAASVRVHDRRENPSHGYRAVHLVAKIDGMPVEVQIRTFLQDEWAQLFESLADRWGRQIRYGSPPDRVLHEAQRQFRMRADLVDWMRDSASTASASADNAIQTVMRLRREVSEVAPDQPGYQDLVERVAELEAGNPALIEGLTQLLDKAARIANELDGTNS